MLWTGAWATYELLGAVAGVTYELPGAVAGVTFELLGAVAWATYELLGAVAGVTYELLGAVAGATFKNRVIAAVRSATKVKMYIGIGYGIVERIGEVPWASLARILPDPNVNEAL